MSSEDLVLAALRKLAQDSYVAFFNEEGGGPRFAQIDGDTDRLTPEEGAALRSFVREAQESKP